MESRKRHSLGWAVDQINNGATVTSDTIDPKIGYLRLGIARGEKGNKMSLIGKSDIDVHFPIGTCFSNDWYIYEGEVDAKDKKIEVLVTVDDIYEIDKAIIMERINQLLQGTFELPFHEYGAVTIKEL